MIEGLGPVDLSLRCLVFIIPDPVEGAPSVV